MARLSLVKGFKSRKIVGRKSLEEIVEMIKSPKEDYKNICMLAKTLGKEHETYHTLKQSLLCTPLNFIHSGDYVNGSSVSRPSGYLYIDVDGNVDIDLTSPHIAAYWRSLSFTGYSVVVRVEGLDKSKLREATTYVGNLLGLPFDTAAISVDRLTIIPYDSNAYYNHSAIPLVLTYDSTPVVETRVSNSKSVSQGSLNSKQTCSNTSDTLKVETKSDLIAETDFEGRVYVDLGKKVGYADISYRYKTIPVGSRNNILFWLGCQLKALNPTYPPKRIYGMINDINLKACTQPLESSEVFKIANSIENTYESGGLKLSYNRTCRFLFNPQYNLTPSEKQSIVAKHIARLKSEKTLKKITDFIESTGETSPTVIARELKIGRATVYRHLDKVG